jgi:hypothetical protein
MHSHYQRAQLLLIEVLNLINEDSDSTLPVLCCLSDGNKKVGQVNLQVSTVG